MQVIQAERKAFPPVGHMATQQAPSFFLGPKSSLKFILFFFHFTTIQRICEGKVRESDGLIFRKLDETGKIIIPIFQTRKRKTQIYAYFH